MACAKIKEVGHQIDPHAVFGTMLADCTFYPATCRPKDVVLTMKKNRMQYFFSDVQLRGEYPVYALRYFKERNINVQLTKIKGIAVIFTVICFRSQKGRPIIPI